MIPKLIPNYPQTHTLTQNHLRSLHCMSRANKKCDLANSKVFHWKSASAIGKLPPRAPSLANQPQVLYIPKQPYRRAFQAPGQILDRALQKKKIRGLKFFYRIFEVRWSRALKSSILVLPIFLEHEAILRKSVGGVCRETSCGHVEKKISENYRATN